MKTSEYKKWLLAFTAVCLAITILFAAVTYAVDPYCKYRATDNKYALDETYVAEGLVKNYNYDTIIIGSCMTQNFDMQKTRELLHCNPLHIGLFGMNNNDMLKIIKLADTAQKANNYYLCIDLFNFTENSESSIPDYLINDNLASALRYTFSYESWFKFMPVDLGLAVYKGCGGKCSKLCEYGTSIDRLGDWSLEYSASEEAVINGYKAENHTVNIVNTESLYNQMKENIDLFLAQIDFENAEYNFFFPPYSALFWCDGINGGYYDACIMAKRYFVNEVTAKGCTVYDFQSEDCTVNLGNYMDTKHYCSDINDYMLECFANGSCEITTENFDEYSNKLYANILLTREKYSYLFEQ